MIIKLELLVQLMPVVLLGLFWKRAQTKAVISGFVVGTLLAILGVFGSDLGIGIPNKVFGFHMGILAMILNTIICIVVSLVLSRTSPSEL